jgi:uncharacterized protein
LPEGCHVLAVGPHYLSDGPESLGYAAVTDRLNLQVIPPDHYANRLPDSLHPAVWRYHVTVDALTMWLTFGSCAAGFLGSLTGMGGGVVIVPLLTLGFGVDMRYAIGASLVSVIATSSASAATYVKDGYSNIRVGMLLEVGTTLGAVGGAVLAALMPLSAIAAVFGAVLLWSAYQATRRQEEPAFDAHPDRLSAFLRLDSSYPTPAGLQYYHVCGIPLGFVLMVTAGLLSGLLGIGSGALKVVAMDRVMRLPYKVSTTTSNFMIGVTAAASAGLYLRRGYIDPGLAMPVMLGVLAGATLGTRVLVGAKPPLLRLVFALVVAALGVQMLYHGLRGSFEYV